MSAPASPAPPHALDGWVERHREELTAYLRRFVGSDDADDLLQEVWIRAFRRPPTGGPGSNARAWLYRVARRVALDHLSREGRRRRLLLEGRAREVAPSRPAVPADPAEAEEVRRRVRSAVARLPRKQREAVWLRWIDGLRYEEVAKRLECSHESARANVHQGIKRLRRDLAELLEGEER